MPYEKTHRHTQGEHHVWMGAEMGMRLPGAEEPLRLREELQEARQGPPLETSEEAWPCEHLVSGPWPPTL